MCLYIEDIYDYMQPELIAVLQEKFEDVWRRGLLVPVRDPGSSLG